MKRFVLAAVAPVALSCARAAESVPSPDCGSRTANIARAQRQGVVPDAALASNDSGRLFLRVAASDSVTMGKRAIARGIALPTRDRLVFRPVEPGSFLATIPAGSAQVLVNALGYEKHYDTLQVRAGFTDTVTYWLRPACVLLEHVQTTHSE